MDLAHDGQWKLHLPHSYRTLEYPGADGLPGKYDYVQIDTSLFDMVSDPLETNNVINLFPDVRDTLLYWARVHGEKFYKE